MRRRNAIKTQQHTTMKSFHFSHKIEKDTIDSFLWIFPSTQIMFCCCHLHHASISLIFTLNGEEERVFQLWVLPEFLENKEETLLKIVNCRLKRHRIPPEQLPRGEHFCAIFMFWNFLRTVRRRSLIPPSLLPAFAPPPLPPNCTLLTPHCIQWPHCNVHSIATWQQWQASTFIDTGLKNLEAHYSAKCCTHALWHNTRSSHITVPCISIFLSLEYNIVRDCILFLYAPFCILLFTAIHPALLRAHCIFSGRCVFLQEAEQL